MKKLSIKLAIYCLMAISVFFSCETEDVVSSKNIIQTTTIDPLLEDRENFLVFSSLNSLDDSVKILTAFNRHQLDSWEKSKNFISLRRTFETILDFEINQNIIEEEMIKSNKSLIKTLKHKYSPLINNNREMISKSNEYGFNYKLFDSNHSYVINKDGIVKIGNSIYKFGEDNIKQILDSTNKRNRG
jgi:hypothetical protein